MLYQVLRGDRQLGEIASYNLSAAEVEDGLAVLTTAEAELMSKSIRRWIEKTTERMDEGEKFEFLATLIQMASLEVRRIPFSFKQAQLSTTQKQNAKRRERAK